MSIPSYSTELGHLALFMNTEEFTEAKDANPFQIPTNRGLAPANPITTSGRPSTRTPTSRTSSDNELSMLPFTAAETIRKLQFQQKGYRKYLEANSALRNLILNTENYIHSLKHDRTGYARVSPLQLMTHIWNTYVTVEDGDQTHNEKLMKTQWKTTTPIETLFEELDDEQKFAAKGGETIHDSQVVRWAYENVSATGLFSSACKKWRERTSADKTWDNFKTYFIKEEDDHSRNSPTSSDELFTANQVQ